MLLSKTKSNSVKKIFNKERILGIKFENFDLKKSKSIKIDKISPLMNDSEKTNDSSNNSFYDKNGKEKDYFKYTINSGSKPEVNIDNNQFFKNELIIQNNIINLQFNDNKKNESFIRINKIFSFEIIGQNNLNDIGTQTEELSFKIKCFNFCIRKIEKKKYNKIDKIMNFSILKNKNEINNDIHIPLKKYFPKGLENYTLNCYMNSLLQCIYYITDFREYFLKNKFEKSMTMCESIKDLMIGLSKKNNENYYKPKKIKNEIKKNQIFSNNKGGDATDLLTYIFDQIMNELSKEESSQETVQYQTKVDDKKLMYRCLYNEIDFNNIIINRLFIGFYEKEYKCEKGHIKYSFQSEYRIVFPLEEISKFYSNKEYLTLYDCFNYYQRTQNNSNNNDKNNKKIDINKKIKKTKNESSSDFVIGNESENESENKSENGSENGNDNESDNESENREVEKCYKCGSNCIIKEKLYRTPEILIIILDRGPDKKYDKKVEFYKKINLKKYIDDEHYEYLKEYELIGVSTHLGSCGNSGHYISFCLCDDNNYYCFNDKNVTKVEWNKSSKRDKSNYNKFYDNSPYILFYQRLSKKEKIINSSIERLKYYTESQIKQINNSHIHSNFSDKNKIKYNIKINQIIKELSFEIDFTNFNSPSDNNREIYIYFEDIKYEGKTLITGTKKYAYRWEKDLLWEQNEEEVEKIIYNCFKEYLAKESFCYIY